MRSDARQTNVRRSLGDAGLSVLSSSKVTVACYLFHRYLYELKDQLSWACRQIQFLTLSICFRSLIFNNRSTSLMQGPEFQHILRILNTNVEGKRNVVFGLTKIPGIGRRFSDLICKKAEVDVNKRAGELTADEIEKVVAVITNPRQFKIPLWFLNRQKDFKTGKYSQVFAQNIAAKLRDDIERMKKIRAHRGLRHWWNIRVRGQHTCSTGRRK